MVEMKHERREKGNFEAYAWVEFDRQDVRSRFAMFECPIEVKLWVVSLASLTWMGHPLSGSY